MLQGINKIRKKSLTHHTIIDFERKCITTCCTHDDEAVCQKKLKHKFAAARQFARYVIAFSPIQMGKLMFPFGKCRED